MHWLFCYLFVLVDIWESQRTTQQLLSLSRLQLFALYHFPMYFHSTFFIHPLHCQSKFSRSTIVYCTSTVYICSVHTTFIFGICILYSWVWYFLMNGNVGLWQSLINVSSQQGKSVSSCLGRQSCHRHGPKTLLAQTVEITKYHVFFIVFLKF